jgi:hypothetical protein
LLERVDEHALVDVLVPAYLLEDHVQLGFHDELRVPSASVSASGGGPA